MQLILPIILLLAVWGAILPNTPAPTCEEGTVELQDDGTGWPPPRPS